MKTFIHAVLTSMIVFAFWSARSFGAAIPGLFNTGVDNAGALLPAGATDPHYAIIINPDSASPAAIVHNDGFPINPSGPWLANTATSKWIAPRADTAGAAGGDYVYRLSFDLTGLDLATARIDGRWSSDNGGLDIVINGISTGQANSGDFTAYTTFAVTSGFVAGLNTLDFRLNNAGLGYTGLRVELSGTALPPDSPPVIVSQPQSQCVSESAEVSFSVIAQGNALTYQWRKDGFEIGLANEATYSLSPVFPDDAGAYDVVVSNPSGSVTSSLARLTVGLAAVNSSFEADRFSAFPGYVSGNGPITGWNSLGNHGVNPGTTFSPFADNGTIPHGRQVAFLQGDGEMSQVVNGFTVGEAYYVHYYENARNGNVPAVAVTINGIAIVPAHVVTSVGGANPYHEVTSEAFTATAGQMTLAFVKSNPRGGDNTVLIDNVCVVQIAADSPPFITRQPESLLVQVGEGASFSVTVVGGLPLRYQWRKDGNPIGNATNSNYSIEAVDELDEADYSVVAANDFGSVTSRVAHLTVFEPIPDLYSTGLDNDHRPLAPGAVDPHYRLVINPDSVSTDALVHLEVFPVSPNGPWLANSATSKWIGPRADSAGAAQGDYVYQTTIDLTGRDPSTVVIIGQWATDNTGVEILVNGLSAGVPQSPLFGAYTPFSLASSNANFLAGQNIIAFRVNNAGAGPTAVRVEYLRSNVKIPPGTPPRITRQPVPRDVKAVIGDPVIVEARAAGTAPLSYQWLKEGVPVPGQTHPQLTLSDVTTDDSGTYSLSVSNSAGTAGSEDVRICVCLRRISGIYGTGVYDDSGLLPGGARDENYVLVSSADPNYPGPDTSVVYEDWPIAPLGPWLATGPNSKWIAPQPDQNQVADPNRGNAPGNYIYRTSFVLDGIDLAHFKIEGRWAVDNTGTDIVVNGVTTGFTSGGFNAFSPFTIRNGLMLGPNTIDFLVNNAGTSVGPTGLRVDMRGLADIQPFLTIKRQGPEVLISWAPTCPGQQLEYATELSNNTQWQVVAGATNPYPVVADQPMRFFRVH